MFTVIILGEGAKGLLARSRVLFAPFEQDDSVGFCDWNQSPTAVAVDQILPDLHSLIADKAEWRAVIVDSARVPRSRSLATDPENPFDYLGNFNLENPSSYQELSLEVSPYPLVRLAHALLGYPEMGVKRFEPVLSYFDPKTRTTVSRNYSPEDGVDPEVAAAIARREYQSAIVTGNDVQIHYREVAYSPTEQDRYVELSRFYQPKEVRPAEVIFVATRALVESDPAVQLRRAWQFGDDQRPSRFVERNDYPSSCRFTVYDLLNPEHSGFQLDVFRFWLTVLCLSVNQLPPSAFQADRVYELGIETNRELLGDMLNAHLSRLVGLRDHLESLLHEQRPPKDTSKDVLPEQRIHPPFEKLGGEELKVSTSGYGLASDSPRLESARWQADFADVQSKAGKFMRRPRRLLAQTIDEARYKARSFGVRDQALSPIERDELEEDLARRLPSLTQPATADILNKKRLEQTLAGHDERISATVRERMRQSTIWIASVAVLLIWVACFVPYLVGAGFQGIALAESVLVVALTLTALVVIALSTLIYLRYRLTRLIGRFNADLRNYVASVENGASAIAEFLSRLATYMYGTSVLNGARARATMDVIRRRRLKAWLEEANDRFAHEKSLVGLLGVQVAVHRPKGGLAELDANDDRKVSAVFQLPKGDRRAEINHSGEYFDTPYDFITRLLVDRASLFEPSADSAQRVIATAGMAPAEGEPS